jgi:hypothetical protein
MSEPAKTADTRDQRIIKINEVQYMPFISNSIKTARYNM